MVHIYLKRIDLETQIIFTVGWIIVSLIWQFIVINNIGGLQAPLAALSFLLSTNAIAQTVIRLDFITPNVLTSLNIVIIFFQVCLWLSQVFGIKTLNYLVCVWLWCYGKSFITLWLFFINFFLSFLVSLKLLIHLLLVTSYLIPLFWLLQLEEP